jgi:photosystem II stability/assembly factor-like uncharacterized protein
MKWRWTCLSVVLWVGTSSYAAENVSPAVKVFPAGEQTLHEQYRRTIVGPGVNEPQAYPGYTGFVGWAGITRTKSGALLVTFSSGYFHASPPTPLGPHERALLKRYGIAEVDAPRGGRAHIVRSDDGGLTWSKPQVLIDTPSDDRSPAATQLADGTLVCSFFTWPDTATGIIRSTDDGKTWEQTPRLLREPMAWTATDGPPLQRKDGSVLLITYGGETKKEGEKSKEVLFRSTDSGATWAHLATIDAPFALDEPSIAELPDGRLVTIARREGAVASSSDNGETWTKPAPLPFKMYDPWLLVLKDGTLICLHGSYTPGHGGLRAILSPDGGKTWHAAGADYGFSVDPSVYGYSRGVQLADGSVYVAYQFNGGHNPEQMKTQKILGLRFRVKDGCSGIDLLPAPGSPAAAAAKQ